MKKFLPLALLLAAACGSGESDSPIKPGSSSQPDRVRVQHVLIAFKGTPQAPASVTRSQDEAEVLAKEILGRAKRGEDFQSLIKTFSTDSGTGQYNLVNDGVPPRGGETKRAQFVPGFTRVAFSLGVGDVGLAEYDASSSPFGYHVIKRIQ
jgi:hypothetical protein